MAASESPPRIDHDHACGHDHSHLGGMDGVGIAARLDRAQALCHEAGERMTAPRQRALELILMATGPIKAYDLIERFHDHGPAKPQTVYRALSFLEQLGLIHRIESLNAYVACHADPDGAHAHRAAFLLCRCCGQSHEIALGELSGLSTAVHRHGFKTEHVTIEINGLCRRCAGAA